MDNNESHSIAAKAFERNSFMDNFCKTFEHSGTSCACLAGCGNDHSKRRVLFDESDLQQRIVTRSIPEKDRSEAISKTLEAEPLTSRLLSMHWIVDIDTLEVCRGADKEVTNKITQRAVLSFLASVLDPLGLFSPFYDENAHPTEDNLGRKWAAVE